MGWSSSVHQGTAASVDDYGVTDNRCDRGQGGFTLWTSWWSCWSSASFSPLVFQCSLQRRLGPKTDAGGTTPDRAHCWSYLLDRGSNLQPVRPRLLPCTGRVRCCGNLRISCYVGGIGRAGRPASLDRVRLRQQPPPRWAHPPRRLPLPSLSPPGRLTAAAGRPSAMWTPLWSALGGGERTHGVPLKGEGVRAETTHTAP